MAGHEPYVADPAEPRPQPRLVRARPLVAILALAVAVSALVFLVLLGQAEQDPALDLPATPTQLPTPTDPTPPG